MGQQAGGLRGATTRSSFIVVGLLAGGFAACNTRSVMVVRPTGSFAETTPDEANASAVIEVDRDNPPIRGRLSADSRHIEVYTPVTSTDPPEPLVGLQWNRMLRLNGVPFFAEGALGPSGSLPINSGDDRGIRGDQLFASAIGPWAQRVEANSGSVYWQAGGLLLEPGGEVTLRVNEILPFSDPTGATKYTTEQRASVRLRLRPSVIVVPIDVLVVGRAGGGGNRLGWRDNHVPQLLEDGMLRRFSRAWFDGQVVQSTVVSQSAGAISTSSLTLDARPTFAQEDAQVFDPNSGRRDDPFSSDMNMEIDSVWRQCGVQFRLKTYNEYMAQDDCAALRSCERLTDGRRFAGITGSCGEVPSLLSHLPSHPNSIRVIFTDSLRNLDNQHCGGSAEALLGFVSPRFLGEVMIGLDDTLWSSGDFRRTTVAHELGHAMGLGHLDVSGTPNLMNRYGVSSRVLIPSQCVMARALACAYAGLTSCPSFP